MRPALNDPPSPALLPPGRWYPDHHRRLSAWLEQTARQDGLKVAAFDWDNTCIFNDIGDATWRYQLDHLKLRLDPDALRARVPLSVNGVHTLANGVALAALAADIGEAYAALWPHIQGDAVHTVLASEAHRDFRSKMMHLITATERTSTLGAQVSYRMQATFLDGYSAAEAGHLAREAWQATRAEAVGSAAWVSATPGRAGHVQQSFLTHIALFEEVMDLIRALQAADVDVYIVTASHEPLVAGLIAGLQLPIAPSRVYGMRVSEPEAIYPLTYRAGKVRVIREHLPAAPMLVAGDANTDFEMLTNFAETRIRLVINRNMQGDIRTLYEAPGDSLKPVTTVLQGRDDNRACFIPDYRTIPFGHKSPADI